MATIKLVKSIYTGSDVTALGELATGDTVNLPDGSQLNSQNILTSADVGSTVQAYDATLLNDADIGVSVQAYDATLLNDADIGVSVHPYDATLLNDADIGVSVQAYDSTLLKSADIGSTVQGYDATLLNDADIGVNVQAYDATILKSADIGVSVQAYDADTAKLDVAQTFTAAQTFGASVAEKKVTMGANDIDLSAGNYFTYTLSGAQTLTVSNVASSGSVSAFVLEMTNGGSETLTWFSGITWNGGTAPTLTASGVDTLAFFTHDGGTTWRGFVVGQAMA